MLSGGAGATSQTLVGAEGEVDFVDSAVYPIRLCSEEKMALLGVRWSQGWNLVPRRMEEPWRPRYL